MDVRRIVAFVLIVAVSFGIMGWTSPQLVKSIKLGLDLKGGFEILYIAEPSITGEKVTKDLLVETARNLEKRAMDAGVSEPDVTTEGTNRIRVRLAGVANKDELREKLRKPAVMTFRGPDGTIEMTGSDFVVNGASVGYDNQNHPQVEIKLKDAKKFADITQRLLQKPLAIYMDETEISAPVVQSVIPNGVATISGSSVNPYTYQEAKDLKDTINSGALPLTITEKYIQSVDATLGKQSLERTVEAGMLGSLFILVFMLLIYRLPGVIAAITLTMYVWVLLLVFYFLQTSLTLPGIAAFVLGIGMAVDANIITYERIKEEIRSGKSIMSSIKAGSKSSFRTIVDANLTTIIAGVVLYYIGTGAIQGFALTLIFSIIVSIFTNVFISRLLLQLLIRSNAVKKPIYFGVKEGQISEL